MTQTGLRIGGVVLCGGQSRRMGAAKEWLLLDGEPLVTRVVRVVVSATPGPVVVSCRARQALPPLPPDVAIVHDRVADSGPLAGMAAGFHALSHGCDAAVVIACDHPLIRSGIVSRLGTLLGDHAAVVPSLNGRLYPLLAAYRLTVATLADEMLLRGEYRVQDFVTRCGAAIVPADEFRDIDPELESFRNINEPQDYAQLVGRLER